MKPQAIVNGVEMECRSVDLFLNDNSVFCGAVITTVAYLREEDNYLWHLQADDVYFLGYLKVTQAQYGVSYSTEPPLNTYELKVA